MFIGRGGAIVASIAVLVIVGLVVEARSMQKQQPLPQPTRQDEQVSAVIPSPNQVFGDEEVISDIQRRSSLPLNGATTKQQGVELQSFNEAQMVPIYVSPYLRSERDTQLASAVSPSFESGQESGPAPHSSYAAAPVQPHEGGRRDLKASASYGHGHGHGHGHGGYHGGHHEGGHHGGYDHSGWLDMGAWTGGKGSFGWYADYPVGKKHGHY